MKKSNEQKPNIVHRLLGSTLKFIKETNDNRSKSPVYKFKYELPKSFIKAVDNARITAGYNILPRTRHRSASPSIHQKMTSSSSSLSSSSPSSSSPHGSCNRYQTTTTKMFRSSSTNDIDRVSTKKVQFRRTPRGHVPPHRQRTATPILFPSRPQFRMMMNPNFMMMNRCPRPPNVLSMRSPIPMQQQQMFRLRFR
jgi:hypothetical protein